MMRNLNFLYFNRTIAFKNKLYLIPLFLIFLLTISEVKAQAGQGVNDAAVLAVDSPEVFCVGTHNVVVKIENHGKNQIDSVEVHWEIDGIPQRSVDYKQLLDTINGNQSNTASVTLGSYGFNGPVELKVFTSLPNGVADTINTNDTLTTILSPSLSGTYTVDLSAPASSSNFRSIDSMVTALNKYGVCGPVTINVANRSYNESIYLKSIGGASATNNIVIDGGDSSQTIISHDASAEFATLTLDSTAYVHIKNMTFEMRSDSGVAVIFANAQYDTLSSAVTVVNPSITGSRDNIVFSADPKSVTAGGITNYNLVQNNKIIGGDIGINASGNASSLNIYNQFYNNIIDSVYNKGVSFKNQDSLEFVGNSINMLNNGVSSAQGAEIQNASNIIFSANNIKAPSIGMFYISDNAGVWKRRTEMTNNMIYSSGSFGIYFLNVDSVDFWHNTINVEGNTSFPPLMLRGTAAYDARNNIFSSAQSEAINIGDPDTVVFSKLDYNIYNTYGGTTLFDIDGTSYNDLSAYVAAQSKFNANSIESDPEFVSATDLHIIGSTANEVGDTTVGVTIDIDGDSRPSPNASIVDIGADEFVPPTCMPVNNLGVSYITTDSLTASWDTAQAGGNFEYVLVPCGTSRENGIVNTTTKNSLRIGGIVPDSCYNLYVRQNCSAQDSSIWKQIDFKTAYCTPFFTSASPGGHIDDFSTTNGNQNISNLSTGRSARGYGDFTSDTVAQSPDSSFDFTAVIGGSSSGFIAWVDWNQDYSFGSGDQVYAAGGGSPYSGTITIPSGTPDGNYRMRLLVWTLTQPTACEANRGEYEDYIIKVSTPPSCIPPKDLSADSIALTAVNFNWLEQNSAASWEIEYGPKGFTKGQGNKSFVNAKPATISGLVLNTEYDAYVRSICTAGDSSNWAGPFTFRTANELPFLEDFETFGNNYKNPWPNGWSSVSYVNSATRWESHSGSTPSPGTGPDVDHTLGTGSGVYAYLQNSGGSNGDSSDFIAPYVYFKAHEDSVMLSYWYHAYGNDINGMDVIVDTNGIENVVDSVYNQQQSSSSAPWKKDSVLLIGYEGQSVRLIFRGRRGNGYRNDISFDDVKLYSISTEPIAIPYYPIATLNTSNANGEADSLNVEAWTSGTVVGVDLNAGNGLGFALIDQVGGSQNGIYVYSSNDVSGYTVNEGDSIKVRGTVDQFNGLTQLRVDSIEVISTGNAIPSARLVSNLDESTELQWLQMEDFVLLDSSQTGSYNMQAHNTTDTITIRINAQTDVSDSLADIRNSLSVGDTICVMKGIGGQFDQSSPYTEGYQITPMYFSDMSICKKPVGLETAVQATSGLRFYPNPTKGSFTIATSGLENDNALITIRDISGKVIIRERIINSSSAFKKHYTLEGQAKGLYLISIIDGEQRINKKLILQ